MSNQEIKETGKKNGYFSIKTINPVVRFLTISDFLIISGFGLISPIFAIFIADSVEGGSIEVVGIAATIFLLTKSVSQIPAAYLIDKIRGERDDFWAMFLGSVIFSLIPISYIFISTPAELYIIQFFYGLSTAVTFPSWYAIFTRHIDKDREGLEWGAYNTLIDLGAAASAGMGGFLTSRFGFYPVFLVVSVISLIGSLFLLFVYQDMKSGGILVKNKK